MAPSDEKAPLTTEKHGFFGRIKDLLFSSIGKIFIFLFIVTPIMFISLMMLGGHLMAYVEDWPFQRGYNFMAGAITGGAIVFPADPPNSLSGRFWACVAGAAGVSMFGFIVAVLSNSLVDPIIHVFGLGEGQKKSAAGVFGKLAGLAVIVMIGNCIFAIVFGSLFSWYEDADLHGSWKAIASIELGGGVVFHNQASPQTAGGTLLYTFVGVWTIGVAAVMISIAGGPATGAVSDMFGLSLKDDQHTAGAAASKLFFLVGVLLPATLVCVMVGVACIMHSVTVWHFEGAFWAALPATTGGAAALNGPSNPPLTNYGVVVLICAASSGFFLISVFIGVGAELLGPIIDSISWLQVNENLKGNKAVAYSVAALAVISLVVVPLVVILFAVPIGSLLSYVEGWELRQGIWWSVAVQLGGGMALTSASINSATGMMVGVLAVAWSIGIAILSVGLSGAPVVVPFMDALGLSMTEEELQAFLEAAGAGASISHGTFGTDAKADA